MWYLYDKESEEYFILDYAPEFEENDGIDLTHEIVCDEGSTLDKTFKEWIKNVDKTVTGHFSITLLKRNIYIFATHGCVKGQYDGDKDITGCWEYSGVWINEHQHTKHMNKYNISYDSWSWEQELPPMIIKELRNRKLKELLDDV